MPKSSSARVFVKGSFEQTCGFCGSVYSVEVPMEKGYNDKTVYHCPGCHKENVSKTSTPPKVTLITERTDGKRTRYKNR